MSDKFLDLLRVRFRDFVSKYSFKIFLWAIKMTPEEYWRTVYLMERDFDKVEDAKK